MTKADARLYIEELKDNEPCFVLRAQDILAPDAVRHWAEKVRQYPEPDHEKIAGALTCADQMERWKGAKKLPGTTKAEKVFE